MLLAKDIILNTVLFGDDKVIMASTEVELQSATYALNSTAIKYNLKISVDKTQAVAMKGKKDVRTKIVINSNIIEQINSVKYVG
jgi:hypothetical protein